MNAPCPSGVTTGSRHEKLTVVSVKPKGAGVEARLGDGLTSGGVGDALGCNVAWGAWLHATSVRTATRTKRSISCWNEGTALKVTPNAEQRNGPVGSPRGLRLLPCGWCQIPRTFPSGPLQTVSGFWMGWQSPIFVARLRCVAAHLEEVAEPAGKSQPARVEGTKGWLWCWRRIFLMNDLVGKLDALVADKDAGTGDELPNGFLTLPAKRALPLDPLGHRGKYMPAAE